MNIWGTTNYFSTTNYTALPNSCQTWLPSWCISFFGSDFVKEMLSQILQFFFFCNFFLLYLMTLLSRQERREFPRSASSEPRSRLDFLISSSAKQSAPRPEAEELQSSGQNPAVVKFLEKPTCVHEGGEKRCHLTEEKAKQESYWEAELPCFGPEISILQEVCWSNSPEFPLSVIKYGFKYILAMKGFQHLELPPEVDWSIKVSYTNALLI